MREVVRKTERNMKTQKKVEMSKTKRELNI
jgi:hypothetical protein